MKVLLDAQDSKNKKSFNVNGIVKKIQFTPNNKYLIATAINEYDEACLHVWDLKIRRLHDKFTTNSQMLPFDISPDIFICTIPKLNASKFFGCYK